MTELDVLEKDITAAIKLREDALTKGHVASWEEFKYLTGVVAGLKGALEAIKTAQKRQEEL